VCIKYVSYEARSVHYSTLLAAQEIEIGLYVTVHVIVKSGLLIANVKLSWTHENIVRSDVITSRDLLSLILIYFR